MSRPRDIAAGTHTQYAQRNIRSSKASSTPQRHSQQLTSRDNAELDWRYISTTETNSSEYSAISEEEDEEIQAMVAATAKESNTVQSQRGLGTRALLMASSPGASDLFGTSPGTTHEANDSTDTIKSMRARALDQINGRKGSSSNMASNYKNNNNSNNNGSGSTKRATSTIVSTQGGSYLANRPTAPLDDKNSPREPGQNTSIRAKRRSFGQSTAERSVPRVGTKTTQQEPRHTIPAIQQSSIRKRSSGSFKTQQVLLTSEDEDAPTKANTQDRARYATESGGGGALVSELKALKARVQELEMERMNRSLSGLRIQSPQAATPRSLEKDRGVESFKPLRSPVSATASVSRQKPSRGSEGAMTLTGDTHLRTNPTISTQHVDLLQSAFKTFEKAMSATGSADAHTAVSAMSKIVASAVSMHQTIRTWIMADVALVESSSMNSLQRACDEQIRSLTESLLAIASMQSTDRSLTQSDIAPGGRPYSPRLSSTGSQKFAQGQRLSLAMAGSELGARTGADYSLPYPTRPLSAVPNSNNDPTGSVTPNAMSSSGYWTRTSTISSSATNDSRARASQQGYTSDFSHDRQPSLNSSGPVRYAHAGVTSSRESSPPMENGQGLDQRRQAYISGFQNTTESLHALDSPQRRMTQSPNLEDAADTSAQLARRQASVRNIMARYSQGGPRSPTFGHSSQNIGSGMAQSQYDVGPDSQLLHEERFQASAQQLVSDRLYHPAQQARDNSMSASVEFSSSGHARSSRRPLSQQDHHSYSGSIIPTAPPVRQGSVIHRSGRYANDGVFSDDESMRGWGAASLDQLPQRSKTGSYSVRLQHLRGRLDQMQPLHQQLEEFERQEQYANQQQQQQQQGEFSDGADINMFTDGRTPRFAQRRLPLPKQWQQHSQQYQDIIEHQKHMQRQPFQHHQDMMMTTPSMPSPNSSPSSSSRLDAPSLVSSNSHQGLAGVDARYHLSPRGTADSSTFPRQVSISSISGFSDDGQYTHHQQPQQPKRISQANHRSQFQPQQRQQQQLSHLDGLSPQAQARLRELLAES
ncbi:hypothetical protein BGX21_008300 [Mortierella sp. AD011]|nr:hypothetical protein BGX20_006417 [Mortierella sp. AD010]KAF9397976.1 hypothetical protein BGX21_008300 [Mortierella sp. AD011]